MSRPGGLRHSKRGLGNCLPSQSGWGRDPEGQSMAGSAGRRGRAGSVRATVGRPPCLSWPGQRNGLEREAEKN